MKPQDLIFLSIMLLLLFSKNHKIFAALAIGLLIIAIPLFEFWKFFTAERMVLYSVICIVISVIFLQKKK